MNYILSLSVVASRSCVLWLLWLLWLLLLLLPQVHPNLHVMEEFIISLVSDKLPPHPKFISLDELRDNFEAQWTTEEQFQKETVLERMSARGLWKKVWDSICYVMCCCYCVCFCGENEFQEQSK